MTTKQNICAICAWRATCQKKFSVSGRDIRCPDFVKDVTIKDKHNREKSGEVQNNTQNTGIDK